jgi:hypothetical protein
LRGAKGAEGAGCDDNAGTVWILPHSSQKQGLNGAPGIPMTLSKKILIEKLRKRGDVEEEDFMSSGSRKFTPSVPINYVQPKPVKVPLPPRSK